MIKKIILSIGMLTSSLAMAKPIAIIMSTDSIKYTVDNDLGGNPPIIPDTIIRCATGDGVTRSELITMIDSGADVTNVCTSNITNFSELFYSSRSGGNTAIIEGFDQKIGNWDVSSGTNFTKMFERARSFNQYIGDWDVSNATSLSRMFYQANVFDKDISKWDVSKNTDFLAMFHEAYRFNQDISGWDVSSGLVFGSMFSMSYDFDKDIGDWDVSKGTDFSYMFYAANSFDRDIHLWDVEEATSFTNFQMGSTPLRTDYKPCKFGGNCNLDSDGDSVFDHLEVYNDTDPNDPLSN